MHISERMLSQQIDEGVIHTRWNRLESHLNVSLTNIDTENVRRIERKEFDLLALMGST